MNFFFGLRGRVWLLVILVTMPLFLYSLLVYLDHRAQAMSRAEKDFQQLIRTALVEETYLVKHTREILGIMANAREIGHLDDKECSGLARRLLQTQREYLNFGAIRLDGTLACSGLPSVSAVGFADSPWFREVLERKDFSQGFYLPGSATTEPGIVFAYPSLDAAGRVRGVIFGNLGLGWFSNLAFANRLPPGWEALVIAPEGQVVFRHPAESGESGQLSPDSPLAGLLRNRPAAGMHELTGSDGQSYLYEIAPLHAAGGRIHVVIGAPKGRVLASVQEDFRNHLILLLVLGIASAVLCQQAISRSFVRWAERLHGNIRRIGAGGREIGPQEKSSIRELAEIDVALGGMVDNIKASSVALKASQEHLGLALEGAALGAWNWRLSESKANCNPRFAQMLGFEPDEFCLDAENWGRDIHPGDWPAVLVALKQHLAGEKPIYECEYRMRHKDGRWLWLLVHGRVVQRNDAGEPLHMAGIALDITNRKITEQQLWQRTEELVALVDAMPALVWIARDPRCREIFGNRAANEICGVRNDSGGTPGQAGPEPVPGARFFGDDGREWGLDELPIQQAASQGRPVTGVQVEMRLPDGRNLWLLGNAAPLFDDMGGVRGALGAFVDITQFKAAETDLRRHRQQLESLVAERTYELAVAKEAAERANRVKSQFLANVSHELRTPLNSLMLLVHVLSDDTWGNLTPQQIEYARLIELSGNDLLHLIDELLDLARIETGRLEIQIKSVPFPDVMQSLRRTHRHVAEQKGLGFHMEIDADVPAAIVTDPSRLQQLLRNLLSNAIKFTYEGSVTLRIRRAVSGWRYNNPALASAETVIAFDIVDTGIGIEPAEQERIFESFGQNRGEKADGEDGTGLGLVISREIATLLGGELALASIPGQGSTFTVYLPLVYAGPASVPSASGKPVTAAPETAPDPVLADKMILVVDDDRMSRFALTAILEKQGMQVRNADSGAEALDILSRNTAVDAVFMDIMMPGMDGHQATRAIRESLGRKSLPIIALTADTAPGAREASLAAGCSDYLSKPASKAALLDCLHRWLHPSPVEA